jgi:uncharacterized protein
MTIPDPTGAPHEPAPSAGLLTDVPAPAKWLMLLVLSAALAGVLEYFHMPAALLLGPMIVAILFAVNSARMVVPRLPYLASQSLLGAMIAQSLDGKVVHRFLQDWPIFVSVVFAIILATSFLGYVLAKRQVLPGSTAVWGTSAGGASAMVLMAEAYGADARLVAFMQYLRVVCVASTAAAVAAFVFHLKGGHAPDFVLFPPVDWLGFVETIVVTAIAAFAGFKLRIPAGNMLVPMFVMGALNAFDIIAITLPPWLLAIAYGIIGWRIGLAFTRRLLRHAARAFPQVFLSIVLLIAFGALLGSLLWLILGVDPLTAYLATSPGGLDSIAIIAASTHVDLPLVMTIQTVRFVFILTLSPSISRFVASRV